MTLKHTYVNPIADDPTAALNNETLPSHWNADHTLDSSDTQVLFNDGGTVAGDAGMTFDKATSFLSLGPLASIHSSLTPQAMTVYADGTFQVLEDFYFNAKNIFFISGINGINNILSLHDDGSIQFPILTSNGFVKTSGGDGTLSVDTNTYLTAVPANQKIGQITGFWDGGGAAIPNGTSTICVPCAFAGTIAAYTITVDIGTCTIKTWKKATGTAIPTVSDSISSSGVAIASNTVIRSTTVSDFTTLAVAANDLFIFNITAISGATKISFTLEITKT